MDKFYLWLPLCRPLSKPLVMTKFQRQKGRKRVRKMMKQRKIVVDLDESRRQGDLMMKQSVWKYSLYIEEERIA